MTILRGLNFNFGGIFHFEIKKRTGTKEIRAGNYFIRTTFKKKKKKEGKRTKTPTSTRYAQKRNKNCRLKIGRGRGRF